MKDSIVQTSCWVAITTVVALLCLQLIVWSKSLKTVRQVRGEGATCRMSFSVFPQQLPFRRFHSGTKSVQMLIPLSWQRISQLSYICFLCQDECFRKLLHNDLFHVPFWPRVSVKVFSISNVLLCWSLLVRLDSDENSHTQQTEREENK